MNNSPSPSEFIAEIEADPTRDSPAPLRCRKRDKKIDQAQTLHGTAIYANQLTPRQPPLAVSRPSVWALSQTKRVVKPPKRPTKNRGPGHRRGSPCSQRRHRFESGAHDGSADAAGSHGPRRGLRRGSLLRRPASCPAGKPNKLFRRCSPKENSDVSSSPVFRPLRSAEYRVLSRER